MTEPMVVDRLEDEEDWLDDWLKSEEVKMILESARDLEDMSMEWEKDEMDDSVMEYDAEEFDYIGWLEEELRELRVEEEVLECVRSMRCPGNCDDECPTSDYDGARKSSSIRIIRMKPFLRFSKSLISLLLYVT